MTARPRSTREFFVHGALVAWFVVSRVQQFAASEPVSFPDSPSYLAKASEPIASADFFFGEGRLFTVPLLWAPWVRWFGQDGAVLSSVQLVIACCGVAAAGERRVGDVLLPPGVRSGCGMARRCVASARANGRDVDAGTGIVRDERV